MLSIASIMLPTHDNHGNSLHNEKDRILSMILKDFGGYTISGIMVGVWRNDSGHVYEDKVQRVDIASDWTVHINSASLRGIAKIAAMIMDQECIMVILPDGVRFIERDTNVSLAA